MCNFASKEIVTITYNMEETLNLLKTRVEKTIGREMKTPRDFDFLSARIYALTNTHISATTLKRMWGYLGKEKNHKPQLFTLNTLARAAGYKDLNAFANAAESSSGSDFINNECLRTSALALGEVIRLLWAPDRTVTIRYEGMDMFTVIESVNSKLSAGDTFHVSYIINGEPLMLNCLIHEGGTPTNYICGRTGGVTYSIVRSDD